MFSLLFFFCSCSSEPISVNQEKAPSFTERSMSSAMWNASSLETYQRKVDDIVAFNKKKIASRPLEKPLLFVLGSSSSGGGTRGNNMRFWPEILKKDLQQVHVQSLARGGATTWHMRKVLEGLNTKADVCILYMGYNDRQTKSPRQSIAALEQKKTPQKGGFVAWVSPSEQKENLETMKNWCSHLLLVREYVQERRKERDPYAPVFSSVEQDGTVRAFDPAPIFDKEPSKVVMMDNIHPTPFGHQILADAIKEQIADWLP
jgi:lysophospholipase L1-like esterase